MKSNNTRKKVRHIPLLVRLAGILNRTPENASNTGLTWGEKQQIVNTFAAAPKMLLMLEHVESWLRDGSFDKTDDKCRQEADEIAQMIAKAEGK